MKSMKRSLAVLRSDCDCLLIHAEFVGLGPDRIIETDYGGSEWFWINTGRSGSVVFCTLTTIYITAVIVDRMGEQVAL